MSSASTISFISCVNNENKHRIATSYIEKLYCPFGYNIEIIGIRDAKSMAEGYNKGMKNAKGRYKVYLHQDVWIIHPEFICNLIELFNNNQKIGLIGVIGAKTLPLNGIWWEADNKVGKVVDSHTGEFELIDFSNEEKRITLKNEDTLTFPDSQTIETKYELVEALDGLLMATQYDILWRSDLFDGWHFYDISQCYEFKRQHYFIAVPNQKEPWSIHHCGVVDLNNYDCYRERFLHEYQ